MRCLLAGCFLTAALLGSGPARAAQSYLPVVGPAPAFALIDQDSQTVRSSDLRGKAILLAFMYTHCTTVCPMVTAKMAGLARFLKAKRLLGSRVELVSISFDPLRDTPAWLAKYARAAGADTSSWLFLTGQPAEIAALLNRYDFHLDQQPTGDFDHVSRVYLIDPAGRIRQIYSVSFLDSKLVTGDIQSLLGEQRGIATGPASVKLTAQAERR